MLSIQHIADFALLHASLVYILIILGVIVEGEIAVILAGIFAHLGSLDFSMAFVVVLFAGAIKSVLGYSLGYYLQKNRADLPFICKIENRVRRFFPKFNDRPFWSIFISRFLIFGIYWFALIFAGFNKTKLRIFIKAEILSLFAWSIVMLSLGYFFSHTAISISLDVQNFMGLIIIFLIGFFILEKILGFIVKLFENKY
jgi:membrane protein DedA with SNARE-associated domain